MMLRFLTALLNTLTLVYFLLIQSFANSIRGGSFKWAQAPFGDAYSAGTDAEKYDGRARRIAQETIL